MNRRGQVLVLFVILLPIILAFMGYVFDQCYILYHKNNLQNTARIVCRYALNEENLENIENLALENDKDISVITIKKDPTTIILEKEIPSVFGNILGFNKYKIYSEISCIE